MKRLTVAIFSTAFITACSTIPQQVETANTQVEKKLVKQVQVARQIAKHEQKVDIDLKRSLPLRTAIQILCKQKGWVCDVSYIPPAVKVKAFKGTNAEFFRYLKDEYDIRYKRYGKTFVFKVGEEYNKLWAEPVLEKQIDINVSSVAFEYFISLLSDQVKFPIRLENTIVSGGMRGGMTTGTGGMTGGMRPAGGVGGTPTMGATGGMGGTTRGGMGKISQIGYISYFSRGKTLRQILDEVCGQYDLYWRVSDEAIVISKYQPATFKVSLPFLEKEVDLQDDAYTLTYKKKFFENLEKNLKDILQDPNSKLSLTETGYVSVFARPSEVKVIQKLIEKINEEYTKVIPLKLTILTINLTDSYTAGINLLDLKDLDKLVKTNNTTRVSGTLDLTTANTFTLGVTSKALDAVIEAISRFGNVRVVENSEFRVLNGQPVVYKPVRKKRIISNVSLNYVPVTTGTTTATTTQPTVTTETEDIEEGSNLLIVPYYVDDERIVVDLYRNQSQIESLETFNINLEGSENQIILPTVKKDSSIQQTVLNKGEKMILLSSVIDLEKLNNIGLPGVKDLPLFGLVGGKLTKEKGKIQYMIIVSYDGE